MKGRTCNSELGSANTAQGHDVTPAIFHVGYPKCGSTTLQKNLFALHPEIDNYGRFPTSNIGKECGLGHRPRVLRNKAVDAIYDHIIDGVADNMAEIRATLADAKAQSLAAGRTVVFSDEGVLSTRFADPGLERKAKRISDLFGRNTRILIVFREQSALLKSLYNDFPFRDTGEKYEPLSLRDFVFGEQEAQQTLRASLDFHRVGETYRALFGAENVLMLPLELLAKDPLEFAANLERFSGLSAKISSSLLDGAKQNVSGNEMARAYRRLRLRYLNKNTIPSWLRNLRPVEQAMLQLMKRITWSKTCQDAADPFIVSEIRDMYARSNAALYRDLGTSIDLNSMGYKLLDAGQIDR